MKSKNVLNLSWIGSEENSYLSAALLCSHWSPWDLNGIKLIFEVCIYPVVLKMKKSKSLFPTDKWHSTSVLNLKFSDKWPSFHPVSSAKVAGRHIYTPVDVYLYLLCKIKCEIKIASVKQKTRLLFYYSLTYYCLPVLVLILYFFNVALVRHLAVITIACSCPRQWYFSETRKNVKPTSFMNLKKKRRSFDTFEFDKLKLRHKIFRLWHAVWYHKAETM